MSPPAHLVAGLFNAPAALDPRAHDLAVGVLADWAGAARRGQWSLDGIGEERAPAPYQVVAGVAVIPIHGLLIQRVGDLAWRAALMGISGYDAIRLQFLAALADEDVEAIVLDVDSPGGVVAGCFDLADQIFAARDRKPIWAILGENAYSAAYALASAAERVTVPRTGGTGSVGVIYMHVSIEEALAKAGFAVTLITKGARKADGNEFQALSKAAFAAIQADVAATGAIFDAAVARNRGLAAGDVAALEAATFQGAAGLDVGLADAVMAPDAAFRALVATL